MKVFIGPFPEDFVSERKVDIEVDSYDSWGADNTIAMIAVPILQQLKATKQGYPGINTEDLPEGFVIDDAEDEDWNTEEFTFSNKAWEWILDEMIWALQQCANDCEDDFFSDTEVPGWEKVDVFKHSPYWANFKGMKAYHERIDNGLVLFGKYFRCLWD